MKKCHLPCLRSVEKPDALSLLPGLYSKHVPMVPVLVELWSGLVNLGSWWPNRASYKNINEKTFKM